MNGGTCGCILDIAPSAVHAYSEANILLNAGFTQSLVIIKRSVVWWHFNSARTSQSHRLCASVWVCVPCRTTHWSQFELLSLQVTASRRSLCQFVLSSNSFLVLQARSSERKSFGCLCPGMASQCSLCYACVTSLGVPVHVLLMNAQIQLLLTVE
jgi:hypothetical protein